MTTRQTLCIAAILAWHGASAQADVLALRFGGYHWWQRYDGTMRFNRIQVDLRDDLGFNEEGENVFFIAFEHPIPFLPNILVQHTDLSADATRQLKHSIVIDNTVFSASATARSELDLTHTDVTLYYRIIDHTVHLQAGLTGRVLDHKSVGIEGLAVARANGGGTTQFIDFGDAAEFKLNGILPMLYLAQKFDLPLTGLAIGADLNLVLWRASHLYDGRVNLSYDLPYGLGTELGWRRFDLDYKEKDDRAKVVVDGVYLALSYRF
jgi:outer membrane protein